MKSQGYRWLLVGMEYRHFTLNRKSRASLITYRRNQGWGLVFIEIRKGTSRRLLQKGLSGCCSVNI